MPFSPHPKQSELRAGDRIEFIIPPPIIEDDAGSTIKGEYEFARDTGRIRLTLKVPYGWLSNPSRVYPVNVDPTILIHSVPGTADTFVSQENPDAKFYWMNYLEIQSYKYSILFWDIYSNERIFLKFPLNSNLPTGAVITNARLMMYSYSFSTNKRTIVSIFF